MKTHSKGIYVIPYGMPEGRLEAFKLPGLRIRKTWTATERHLQPGDLHLLVTFAHLLDDRFAQIFQKKATSRTRLLVLNDRLGSDRLLSRLVELQIRSPNRFYVAEAKSGAAHTNWDERLQALLGRLTAGVETGDRQHRIFDARVEGEILHVISPDFTRMEIPLAEIPAMGGADQTAVENFEIDEDGSYLYWPDLDLYLGWEQLQQVIDPAAVQRARQKSRDFNTRYGAAVRKVREEKGLAVTGVPGLSDKQLRRIESGACRLTSAAAGKLASAHGLDANEYLQTLATALK